MIDEETKPVVSIIWSQYFYVAGTDRSNIVQIPDLNDNFPLPYESTDMWKNAEIVWHHHGKTDLNKKDLALGFASAGYFAWVCSCVYQLKRG